MRLTPAMKLGIVAGVTLLSAMQLWGGDAAAQSARQIVATSGRAGIEAPCVRQGDGSCAPVDVSMPLPVISKQESFQLAASNIASSGSSLAGGDYVLTQVCTGYGTVKLQVKGPDGLSWLDMASYTSADNANGHGLVFGSYAQVRVLLSGTTGCNVLISRVPA